MRAEKEKMQSLLAALSIALSGALDLNFLGLFVKRLTGTLQSFLSAKIILKRCTKDANCFKLSACTIYMINIKHIAAFPKETGKFSLKGASIAECVCFGAKNHGQPTFRLFIELPKRALERFLVWFVWIGCVAQTVT